MVEEVLALQSSSLQDLVLIGTLNASLGTLNTRPGTPGSFIAPMFFAPAFLALMLLNQVHFV